MRVGLDDRDEVADRRPQRPGQPDQPVPLSGGHPDRPIDMGPEDLVLGLEMLDVPEELTRARARQDSSRRRYAAFGYAAHHVGRFPYHIDQLLASANRSAFRNDPTQN